MAQLNSESLRKKLASENDLSGFYSKAIDENRIQEKDTRAVGLKVIQAVRSRVDTLLGYAFRAQRSIEIYLLKDQKHAVAYDIGRVHPDLEADYADDPNVVHALIHEYQVSFNDLPRVETMRDTLMKHFDPLAVNTETIPIHFHEPNTPYYTQSDFHLRRGQKAT